MNETTTTSDDRIDLHAIKERIDDLDLDPIKIKLMDPEEGKGWSLERADEVEKWYKRYLFLCAKYDEIPLVPVADIDDFWHQHILDTRKYAADCEWVFGYFLHHFPYFGMRGEDDAAALTSAAEDTLRIFEAEYGETPANSAANKCHECKKCSSCLVPTTNCKHPGCGKKCTKFSPVDAEERPRLIRH